MLKIEDVTFRYEGSKRPALSEVSLEIDRGEFLLIAGLSGSGKSTLLRLLNGLIPHFYRGEMKGKVLVDGVDTREASVAQLSKKVGLVFQNPEHMFFSETVYEEVSFGPKSIGMDPEEIRESVKWALEEVGLWELRERSPWSLSGGEMKRLSIACVLSMKPEFLAVDEPTIGQDSLSKESLLEIFKRMKGEGKGVVIVTHDLEWLDDLGPDLVFVLRYGVVIGGGDPRKIFSDIRNLATNGLIPPDRYIVDSLLEVG
ncbi:MAG: ABC transporter ATP-binding protein [Candidatus Korarchaeota archaeon]|nr:ABC transporter ATP-binding protein [Candidatus Korarchaeota archaeon]